MDFSMKTDKGLVRAENQDNCYIAKFNDKSCFAVVCDGMGGPNAGDVASEIAVKTVSEYFAAHWNNELNIAEIEEILIDAVKSANEKIYLKSKEDSKYDGMGTTLVAAVCVNDDVIAANVGDSRAYFVGDKLQQITKDHSLMQDMLDKGQISKKEAETFPYKNIITRALGADATVRVDTFTFNDAGNNDILLCSDGLYNFVSEDDIASSFREVASEKLAEALINKANSGGGNDNITAVVIFR